MILRKALHSGAHWYLQVHFQARLLPFIQYHVKVAFTYLTSYKTDVAAIFNYLQSTSAIQIPQMKPKNAKPYLNPEMMANLWRPHGCYRPAYLANRGAGDDAGNHGRYLFIVLPGFLHLRSKARHIPARGVEQ
jgi:hypothetical protein